MGRRAASLVVVIVVTGIALGLGLRHLHPQISDRELLREAAKQGATLELIFGQQAGQGYYNDALATARQDAGDLPDSSRELAALICQLIQTRAENGDIQGAKHMVIQLRAELGADEIHAVRGIAFAQAYENDLKGALETANAAGATNDALEAFADSEVAKGKFDEALKTSEKLNERSAYNIFYDIGDALGSRGEQQRLGQLASHMSDRKRAFQFAQAARFTAASSRAYESMQTGPCDQAWSDATQRKFDDADHVIEENDCDYMVVGILGMQYTADPSGAERRADAIASVGRRAQALAEIAQSAARQGDIVDALRLLNAALNLSRDACLDCIREIARAWAAKGKKYAVLRWARSLSTGSQRGYALLGIAEALGHARQDVWPSSSTVTP